PPVLRRSRSNCRCSSSSSWRSCSASSRGESPRGSVSASGGGGRGVSRTICAIRVPRPSRGSAAPRWNRQRRRRLRRSPTSLHRLPESAHTMRIIGGDDIARALTYPALVEALEGAFRAEVEVPVRHHHRIVEPNADATLLIMPAWTEEFLGCKLVTVFPGNAELDKPSVYGTYLLMSGRTGEPLAAIDGRTLTAWRTAAASALAAKYLAREDAGHLLMIGAGALAPHLVRAHASIRPIRRISLWNRTRQRAETLAFPLVW